MSMQANALVGSADVTGRNFITSQFIDKKGKKQDF